MAPDCLELTDWQENAQILLSRNCPPTESTDVKDAWLVLKQVNNSENKNKSLELERSPYSLY